MDARCSALMPTVLTSFDYLQSVPTWAELASACRLSRPMRPALHALACCCLLTLCAVSLEVMRVQRAAQAEAIDARRYAQQLDELRVANVHAKQAKFLTDLDQRIRTIAASGTLAARRLAALADDLPSNVWITAITPDTNGLVLDGRTHDFTGLSDTLIRLNAEPLFVEPSLLNAQVVTPAATPLALRFSLHLASSLR